MYVITYKMSGPKIERDDILVRLVALLQIKKKKEKDMACDSASTQS